MIRRSIRQSIRAAIDLRINGVVDATAPVVTIATVNTIDLRPALSGTVDDPAAVVQVTVLGLEYPAVNHGDGTWSIAAEVIAALPIGNTLAEVQATDLAGNVGVALGTLYRFDPSLLFAAGEQGGWYDPNDLSTLFQDSAGTVPVTAAGQPVGRMLDKSGRGNHVSFGDGANRPMLRSNIVTGYFYLETDGADDFGVTAPVDFTGTNKMSVFTGIRKLSDASTGVVVELGPVVGTTDFALFAPAGGGANSFRWQPQSGAVNQIEVGNTIPAPVSVVLSCEVDKAINYGRMYISGLQVAPPVGFSVSGVFSNRSLYLFRRAGTSLPAVVHFYGLVIVSRLCTDTERRNVERLLARHTGVVLS